MKYVRLNEDKYGRKYVEEIIPEDATPISRWYSNDFVILCKLAPDDVTQNMLYDSKTNEYYPWTAIENDIHYKNNNIQGIIQAAIDNI